MEYTLGLYEKAMPEELSFSKMLEVTSVCGFDRLEISIDESERRQERLTWCSEKQRELGVISRALGIPIRTMCLSGHRKWPLGSHDVNVRKHSMDMMRKAIEFSVNAGISIIQLAGYDVYYEKGDEDTRRWFLDNLVKSTEYAARWGIVLAFETMETPFMDTVEKSMKYVTAVDSPWLGIYPDIGNLENAAILYGTDVTQDMEKGRGHIMAVHLKETKPGKYRDMNFGDKDGHTEYERCIKTAIGMGVRTFTGEFWYQENQDYIKTISDANHFLRGKIEKAV